MICGLSGGVDSATAAALVHRALGDQLTCVLVDHGLMRKNEAEQVVAAIREQLGVQPVHVDAAQRFLARLAGVDDPERKRRIIGEEFIRVFEEEAAKLEGAGFLVQGTLYSDVIESGGDGRAADTIKSHHNVGGLPEDLDFDLIEPLRQLFKDEVRAVGAELGLPERFVWRQPFPGPGLAIRIVGGEVTASGSTSCARPTRSSRRRSARPASTASSGSRSACCRRPLGRRPGRRAHLRLPDRDPRGHLATTR